MESSPEASCPICRWAAKRLKQFDKEIADLSDRYQTAMKEFRDSPKCQILRDIYQSTRQRLIERMRAARAFSLALSNAGVIVEGEARSPLVPCQYPYV